MKARSAAVAAIAVASTVSVAAAVRANEGFKLPPEVTPKLRAACESDVRRLCIRENSTVASVKSCVLSKFMQLGSRCKLEIAQAGLAP
jgi:hypothetical protein